MVTGSRDVAEDCVQEALARAWQRSLRGEPIDSLIAWVTTVSLNLSRSWHRRLRAETRARERLVGLRDAELAIEEAVDIDRALRALPKRQREVAVLRYYLGFDVKEIAQILGVREGTVKSSLARGRQALAAALHESQDEEPSFGR